MIVAIIWGFNWTNMKIGLSYTGSMNYLFQRLFFSAFMIAPFLFFVKNGFRRDSRTIINVILQSATSSISMVFMMLALQVEGSGISAIVTYTQPLFVFVLSAIFLKNEITKMKITGVLLGFVGIGIIYLEKLGSGTLEAFLFLVISAFLWAVSIVYYKLISSSVHPYWISFSGVAVGSFIVLPLALATGGISFIYEPTYVLSVVYMTVLSTVLAFFLWFYLLKNEDATTVSSSSLLIPIIAFVAGAFLLEETVNLYQIVGVVMVLFGIYLVNKNRKA